MTMTDVKLGKRPAVKDARTLQLGRYVRYGTSQPTHFQLAEHWGYGLPYTVLGNDQYGDCVEAAYGHAVQVWSARVGAPITPTALGVLDAYTAITGFNPDDPATDQGTDMLSALRYWKASGLAGVKIDAYAAVNPAIDYQVNECIAEFGGAYIGLAMPLSAQNEIGAVWDVGTGPDARPGSWGGHCVLLTGYGPGFLYCVTWGRIQTMTWNFFSTYCDEAYALLSHEWLERCGKSPSGLYWGQLQADLANI